MENCKSTFYSYPEAYRFMKKTGARKSCATVPFSCEKKKKILLAAFSSVAKKLEFANNSANSPKNGNR